eukprot:CAMPEP_0181308034 /NCGR_PEP_ID=MMETSP1101-20121128/11226_1 /TAXON_ID=46948 /ORGANISM="Rhodomonas abbreviata, Strain Caron Lab Isolate" /LENGTH=363 /DNA_ID=CAMNT_0023414347 /DNA_START=28 /DNA_END=1116 /DNA_ORIENTATION=-
MADLYSSGTAWSMQDVEQRIAQNETMLEFYEQKVVPKMNALKKRLEERETRIVDLKAWKTNAKKLLREKDQEIHILRESLASSQSSLVESSAQNAELSRRMKNINSQLQGGRDVSKSKLAKELEVANQTMLTLKHQLDSLKQRQERSSSVERSPYKGNMKRDDSFSPRTRPVESNPHTISMPINSRESNFTKVSASTKSNGSSSSSNNENTISDTRGRSPGERALASAIPPNVANNNNSSLPVRHNFLDLSRVKQANSDRSPRECAVSPREGTADLEQHRERESARDHQQQQQQLPPVIKSLPSGHGKDTNTSPRFSPEEGGGGTQQQQQPQPQQQQPTSARSPHSHAAAFPSPRDLPTLRSP